MFGIAHDSLVLTKEGFKPIQDLEIGELVLTHLGNWKPVMAKIDMGVNQVVQLRAQGIPNLFLAPNHQVWAKVINKVNAKKHIYTTPGEWFNLTELDGGWVGQPLGPVEESSLSMDEWNIVGKYLGYAHANGRSDFLFEILTRLLNSELSDNLKEMLRRCGKDQATRQVPIEGISLNQMLSEALLSGYVFGRGDNKNKMDMIYSVSRGLSLGMAIVAQRARNIVPSLYASEKNPDNILWALSWTEYQRQQRSSVLRDGVWKKFKDVDTNCGELRTWNLQVADDNSYMAEGCAVKGESVCSV